MPTIRLKIGQFIRFVHLTLGPAKFLALRHCSLHIAPYTLLLNTFLPAHSCCHKIQTENNFVMICEKQQSKCAWLQKMIKGRESHTNVHLRETEKLARKKCFGALSANTVSKLHWAVFFYEQVTCPLANIGASKCITSVALTAMLDVNRNLNVSWWQFATRCGATKTTNFCWSSVPRLRWITVMCVKTGSDRSRLRTVLSTKLDVPLTASIIVPLCKCTVEGDS